MSRRADTREHALRVCKLPSAFFYLDRQAPGPAHDFSFALAPLEQAPAARFLRARAATGPCGLGPRGKPAPLRVGRAAALPKWSKILSSRREGPRCWAAMPKSGTHLARGQRVAFLAPVRLALGGAARVASRYEHSNNI